MSDMWARLFGATQEQLADRTGLALRFAQPWRLWWLAIALLALLVYWCYRREAGTAGRRAKIFLGTLRFICLLAVLLLIFHPVLVIERSYMKDSWLILLLDDSMSMSIKDPQTDRQLTDGLAAVTGIDRDRLAETARAALVNAALSNDELNLIGRLAKTCKVRIYNFSDRISPMPLEPGSEGRPDDGKTFIEAKGRVTAIGDAIYRARAELRGQRIAAIVVVTDGRSNSGRPVEDAVETAAVRREQPFPIFTVGVGNPSAVRDLVVQRIFGNDVIFVDDIATFNVVVSQKGCAGQTAWLRLYQGERELESKSIVLDDALQQTVKMNFKPTVPGKYKYSVKAEPLPGELTDRNNASPPHIVEVIDKHTQVLLIAGGPSWEYRYLKNALIRDQSVKVSCLLQGADEDFFQEGNLPISGFPDGREQLFKYDVIILLDPNPSGFADTHLSDIAAFVEDLGGGLIFAAGEVYGPSGFSGTLLEKCLPVVIGRSEIEDPLRPRRVLSQSFQPQLTPQGMEHPVAQFEAAPTENLRLWQNLPGFFWYHPVERLKPAATSLIEHPTEGNQYGKFPLVAAHFYGRGRVLFSAVDSTWRWRFQRGDRHFYKFWGQAVRFVSSGKLLGESKRLSIATVRADYTVGDPVVLHARCLDSFFRPTRAEQIEVTIQSGTGEERKMKLLPLSDSPGMFRGSFVAAAPGTYTAHLQSPDAGSASASSQPFTVRLPAMEFEDPSMNAELLRKVARETGGSFFHLGEIGQLPGNVNAIREEVTEEDALELIGARTLLWAVLALFTAIIATEWWLRKRKMLM